MEDINLIGNEWTSNQSSEEGSCRCLMCIPSSHIGTLDIALSNKLFRYEQCYEASANSDRMIRRPSRDECFTFGT